MKLRKMIIYNSLRFVSDKPNVSPNESLQTTDIAAGECFRRNGVNKTKRKNTQKNQKIFEKLSGKGLKIIE